MLGTRVLVIDKESHQITTREEVDITHRQWPVIPILRTHDTDKRPAPLEVMSPLRHRAHDSVERPILRHEQIIAVQHHILPQVHVRDPIRADLLTQDFGVEAEKVLLFGDVALDPAELGCVGMGWESDDEAMGAGGAGWEIFPGLTEEAVEGPVGFLAGGAAVLVVVLLVEKGGGWGMGKGTMMLLQLLQMVEAFGSVHDGQRFGAMVVSRALMISRYLWWIRVLLSSSRALLCSISWRYCCGRKASI